MRLATNDVCARENAGSASNLGARNRDAAVAYSATMCAVGWRVAHWRRPAAAAGAGLRPAAAFKVRLEHDHLTIVEENGGRKRPRWCSAKRPRRLWPVDNEPPALARRR